MERHTVAVARHRDIGAVAIHARCRKHVSPVYGHPLRLVDRGGVAVIEVAIGFRVDRNRSYVVGAHRHTSFAYPLDLSVRAVLFFQTAAVAPEHAAVATGTIQLLSEKD